MDIKRPGSSVGQASLDESSTSAAMAVHQLPPIDHTRPRTTLLHQNRIAPDGIHLDNLLSARNKSWLENFILTPLHSSFNRETRALSPKLKVEEDESLPGQRDSQAPAPRVVRQVPSPKLPLSWYRAWPQIVQYYLHHQPDYTGAMLYRAHFDRMRSASMRSWHELNDEARDDLATSNQQAFLCQVMPVNFTAAIYFAENARMTARLPTDKILWLRLQTIALMNKRLSNVRQALTVENLAVVSHFVAETYAAGDMVALEVHVKGLLNMMKLMRTRAELDKYYGVMVLTKWAISLAASCGIRLAAAAISVRFPERDPLLEPMRIDPSKTFSENMVLNAGRGALARYLVHHPLRLSLQPRHSGMNEFQRRHHLATAVGGPTHDLLFIHAALADTFATLDAMAVGPDTARAAIESLHRHLVTMEDLSESDNLPTPPFAPSDAQSHRIILECTRLSLCVLTLQAIHIIQPTLSSLEKVQEAVTAFSSVEIDPRVVSAQPEVVLWTLFSVASFCTVQPQRRRMKSMLCECSKKLRLQGWAELESLLVKFSFCKRLQETAGVAMWMEMCDPLDVGVES